MLVMLGGECNRSFAHYKYSIASPPGSLHFHPLLFYHPGRGSRIGFLQVPRKRLPHVDAQGFTIKWRRRFRLRTDFFTASRCLWGLAGLELRGGLRIIRIRLDLTDLLGMTAGMRGHQQ